MSRLCLAFILLLSFSQKILAQEEEYNWVFGDSVRISFQNGSAQVSKIPVYTDENCSSISDKNGNLIFYLSMLFDSNNCLQMRICNAQQNYLQNGIITSDCSETQGSLFIPSPNDTNQYYFFCLGFKEVFVNNSIVLRYSILDKTKNNGNGGFISTENILFDDSLIEKMTAIKHSNGIDWWILIHKSNSKEFVKYKLSKEGIIGPFFQTIGDSIGSAFTCDVAGEMVPNQEGSKIVFATTRNILDVYNFDRCTGNLSSRVAISNNNGGCYGFYGCSFSPDGSKLYASTVTQLFQYNLDSIGTSNFQTLIYTNNIQDCTIGQHQLAPDGKIYIVSKIQFPPVADLCNDYISVINNPNEVGVNCNFQPHSLYLGGGHSGLGLPNMVNYNLQGLADFAADAGEDKIICKGGKVQLGIPPVDGAMYEWYYQGWLSATNLDNTHVAQPWATPNGNTTYWLRITDTTTFSSCNVRVDTVTITVAQTPCNDGVDFFVPTFFIASDKYFFIHNLPANTALIVYNTLGQLIYHSNNYQNDFNIQLLASATYFYRFNLANGEEVKGKLMVMR